MCRPCWRLYERWAGKANIYVGLEGYLDLAILSWRLFSLETNGLASSKGHDSSTECLDLSHCQLKASSAGVSYSVVLASFLVPCATVSGPVSKQNGQFICGTNLT